MKNKLESADLDRQGKIRQDKSYGTWQDKNLSDIWLYNHLFHWNRSHIGWQLEIFALIWRFLSDFYRFYPYYDQQVSQNCFQNLNHSIIPSSFHEFLWYWDYRVCLLVGDRTLKSINFLLTVGVDRDCIWGGGWGCFKNFVRFFEFDFNLFRFLIYFCTNVTILDFHMYRWFRIKSSSILWTQPIDCKREPIPWGRIEHVTKIIFLRIPPIFS